MYQLMYKREVLPKSLLLKDVKINVELGTVPMGGFGRVYRGKHKGQQVALKVVERGSNNVSATPFFLYNTDSFGKDLRRKAFYWETLAWQSLSHRFILPLKGIFEDASQAYFVTPFMPNGTLIQWRRQSKAPDVPSIHRLVRIQSCTERSITLLSVRYTRSLRACSIFTQKDLCMATCVECVF